jgi:hypothetical protein
MATEKKIPGRMGDLPPQSPSTPINDPTPRQPEGKLVKVDGQLFVVTKNGRIPVTDPSGLTKGRPVGKYRPGPSNVDLPGKLKEAVEVAGKCRTAWKDRPSILGVRAGYLFKNGSIQDEAAIVVAIKPEPGRTFNKEQIRRDLGLPDEVKNIPIDIEMADPFLQVARLYSQPRIANTRPESLEVVPPHPRLLIDDLQVVGDELETAVSEGGHEETVPITSYEPPNFKLEPVSGPMTITCHVSPDAGWRVLEPFLQATKETLHLGMYDFTAPHIYETARSLLKTSGVTWQQVLDPKESLPGEDDTDSNKANDKTEKSIVEGLKRIAGRNFKNVFAKIGASQTFASAYHIKVAVRDSDSFWLSSGNWQSSNQPDIDFFAEAADRQLITKYNREWHVVIENPKLAEQFQRFLDYDFKTASELEETAEISVQPLQDLLVPVEELLEEERAAVGLQVFAPRKFTFTAAKPVTVQPILTPDNYLDVVLRFLERKPKKRFYFQNQSLNPIKNPTKRYDELLKLLVEYSNDDQLDARFIFRNIGPIRKKLESLKAYGFNMDRIRVQSGCHTKGIIVDSETILLGGHNITNQGVEVNRDASLLISDKGIAEYYEAVFLHDWEKLAKPTIREESMPIFVTKGEESALVSDAEVARVPFSYFEEE